MQGVSLVYNELRSKGIDFPKASVEPKVPIHTPHQRSVSKSTEVAPYKSATTNSQSRSISPQRSQTATINRQSNEIYPLHLSPEQLNKLKSELEVVQGNMKVLSEMLTEMSPGHEHKDDWDLLVDLHKTCEAIQKRIVELIEKVANEEVTNELLRINEELNNLFMRFERYKKKRGNGNEHQDITMIASTSADMKTVPIQNRANQTKENVPSLIDFTDDVPDALTTNLNHLRISSEQQQQKPFSTKVQPIVENIGDQEFDMFAQSRSNTVVPSSSNVTSKDLHSIHQITSETAQQQQPQVGIFFSK